METHTHTHTHNGNTHTGTTHITGTTDHKMITIEFNRIKNKEDMKSER